MLNGWYPSVLVPSCRLVAPNGLSTLYAYSCTASIQLHSKRMLLERPFRFFTLVIS